MHLVSSLAQLRRTKLAPREATGWCRVGARMQLFDWLQQLIIFKCLDWIIHTYSCSSCVAIVVVSQKVAVVAAASKTLTNHHLMAMRTQTSHLISCDGADNVATAVPRTSPSKVASLKERYQQSILRRRSELCRRRRWSGASWNWRSYSSAV